MNADQLLRRAAELRDSAKRAKRLAGAFLQVEDGDRLNRYAQELEKEADDLERQARDRG